MWLLTSQKDIPNYSIKVCLSGLSILAVNFKLVHIIINMKHVQLTDVYVTLKMVGKRQRTIWIVK